MFEIVKWIQIRYIPAKNRPSKAPFIFDIWQICYLGKFSPYTNFDDRIEVRNIFDQLSTFHFNLDVPKLNFKYWTDPKHKLYSFYISTAVGAKGLKIWGCTSQLLIEQVVLLCRGWGEKKCTDQLTFYNYFKPNFCHLHEYLSQNWSLDGHFEVLNGSVS